MSRERTHDADHDYPEQAGPLTAPCGLEHFFDALDEQADRPTRCRVLAHAWEMHARHRRAYVEAGYVIGYFRATCHFDKVPTRVDSYCAANHNGRPSAPGQS